MKKYNNHKLAAIAATLLAGACWCSAQTAVTIGDFEGGLDGWAPSGSASATTLATSSIVGVTTGAESLQVADTSTTFTFGAFESPIAGNAAAIAVLTAPGAAVTLDYTALPADITAGTLSLGMYINADNGAGGNNLEIIPPTALIVDGTTQTITISLTDNQRSFLSSSPAWANIGFNTNTSSARTFYVDNIQVVNLAPPPPGIILGNFESGSLDGFGSASGAATAGVTLATDTVGATLGTGSLQIADPTTTFTFGAFEIGIAGNAEAIAALITPGSMVSLDYTALPEDVASGAVSLGMYINADNGAGGNNLEAIPTTPLTVDGTAQKLTFTLTDNQRSFLSSSPAWANIGFSTGSADTRTIYVDNIEVIDPSSETTILISNVSRSGNSFIASFTTSSGNVDVYKSTDLQDFGVSPINTGVVPGDDVTLDSSATELGAFYVLVPEGSPAP